MEGEIGKSAVWDLLHDGGIDAASGRVPGEITVVVGIQYLCAILPTQAEQLVLRLGGCRSVRIEANDGSEGSDLAGVVDWEILSAEEVSGGVEVCCVQGMLRLEYEGLEVRSKEGRVVSLEELREAAERYWKAWKEGTLPDGGTGD